MRRYLCVAVATWCMAATVAYGGTNSFNVPSDYPIKIQPGWTPPVPAWYEDKDYVWVTDPAICMAPAAVDMNSWTPVACPPHTKPGCYASSAAAAIPTGNSGADAPLTTWPEGYAPNGFVLWDCNTPLPDLFSPLGSAGSRSTPAPRAMA